MLERAQQVVDTLVEEAVQPYRRAKLESREQRARFATASGKYREVLARTNPAPHTTDEGTPYPWAEWVKEISGAFSGGVPWDFLKVRQIATTMVFGRRRGQYDALERCGLVSFVFEEPIAATLLREDAIGSPNITDTRWLTSANRAHQASHLAVYANKMRQPLWTAPTICEWGGGYGNMARIVRKVNPSCTYVIVDLPELLALQWVYLTVAEGVEPVVLLPGDAIVPGKVNLVSSPDGASGSVKIVCDAFLSTWALTESPLNAQHAVLDEHKCFGASRTLLAYRVDDGNAVAGRVEELKLQRTPVPFLAGHAYALR